MSSRKSERERERVRERERERVRERESQRARERVRVRERENVAALRGKTTLSSQKTGTMKTILACNIQLLEHWGRSQRGSSETMSNV